MKKSNIIWIVLIAGIFVYLGSTFSLIVPPLAQNEFHNWEYHTTGGSGSLGAGDPLIAPDDCKSGCETGGMGFQIQLGSPRTGTNPYDKLEEFLTKVNSGYYDSCKGIVEVYAGASCLQGSCSGGSVYSSIETPCKVIVSGDRAKIESSTFSVGIPGYQSGNRYVTARFSFEHTSTAECTTEKCDGTTYYTCENEKYVNQGEVDGKCGYIIQTQEEEAEEPLSSQTINEQVEVVVKDVQNIIKGEETKTDYTYYLIGGGILFLIFIILVI